ncbi:MAG: Hpt domain-containing protein [Desulfobacterales bacterium]|jgi:two-component system chemotaxis sensor kinase CheA
MFELSLLEDFLVEAREHLAEMESGLLQLETNSDDRDILNDIFRSIHTIKGSAKFVGLERVSELSHKLENLLELLRQGQKQVTRDIIGTLIEAKDRITLLVDDLERSQAEEALIDDLVDRVELLVESTVGNDAEQACSEVSEAVSRKADKVHEAEETETVEDKRSEEECDQELFDIYIGQLKDNISFLRSQLEETDSSDNQHEVLQRFADSIETLKSSANYMDYQKLVFIYKSWLTKIEEAKEGLSEDKEVSLDFMKNYIDKIVKVFPQVGESENELEAEVSSEKQVDAPTSIDNSEGPPLEEGLTFLGDTEEPLLGEDTLAFVDKTEESLPEEEAAASHAESEEPLIEDDLILIEELEDVPSVQDVLPPTVESESMPQTIDLTSADKFDLSLLEDFLTEAGEHLVELESDLLQLETEPDRREVLDDIFRSIHTIKGAAEFVGLEKISELSHELENLLELLRLDKKQVNRDIIDTLIEGKDRTALLVEDLHGSQAEEALIDDLVARIKQLIEGPVGDSAEQTSSEETEAVSGKTDEAEETKSAVTVEEQSYEEEYDHELFDIFIGQLKENISFLRSQYEEPDASSNMHEVLESCADSIKRLKSSANYMDYQNLVAIYKDWIAEIDRVKKDWSNDDQVSLGFMETYIEKVFKIFPQADELASKLEGETSGEKQMDTLDCVNEPEEPLLAEENLTSLDESENPRLEEEVLTFLDESEDSLLEAENLNSLEKPENPHPEEELNFLEDSEIVSQATDSDSDENKLFETLGLAFDTSTAETVDAEPDPLSGVIEQMLCTDTENGIAEPSSVKVPQQNEAPQTNVKHLDGERDEPIAEDLPTSDRSADRLAKTEDAINRYSFNETDVSERVPENRIEQPKSDSPGERILKQSVRVSADKIDVLMNQVGELVVSRAFFSQLSNEIKILQQHLKEEIGLDQKQLKPVRTLSFRMGEAIVSLGRVANDLQEGVMKVRMLPISQLFNRYPRLVRDLSHNSDKQVQLEIRGGETELDKMIIEEISDPLIHIIRNAVDHGIETRKERRDAGKPEIGTLTLEAYHESNHIVIEITDDGRGLDPDYIKAKALAKGFLPKDELNRMSEKELTRIIMVPGFSTADKVSHTSGRGVGMDVVKKNIEKLNGTIEINSTPGVKTQMRIKIPLTLAIIQALMVRVGTDLYTIPLSAVEETLRISGTQTSLMEGVEVIHMRDRTMPIFRLSDMFGLTPDKQNDDRAYVVIVSTGMQEIGLVVDELVGQEEVVIKPLVDYLQENSGFSGATIIRDGKISLILDVYELVNMTIGMQTKRHKYQSLESVSATKETSFFQVPVPGNA